eukprot:4826537-Prymnesium_polylepis.1
MPPPCAGVYMKCTSPPPASMASTSRTTSSIASPPLRPHSCSSPCSCSSPSARSTARSDGW